MRSILRSGDLELAATLKLGSRRRYAGLGTGEQRSPEAGGGIEFADYRPYAPGDDLRRVDWDVWRRLGRLYVRIPAEERELSLIILLDASRSMSHGEPQKMEHAKRLACVLAATALCGGHRAGLCVLGPGLVEVLRPSRGKSSLEAFERAAASVGPLASFEPLAAAAGFLARYARRCMVALISDLMFPQWRTLLGALSSSGCETQVLQVLSPDELSPEIRGEVTFVDSEDLSEAPVHADATILARYAAELRSFLESVSSASAAMGLGWSLVPTDGDLSRLFRDELRAGGFLC